MSEHRPAPSRPAGHRRVRSLRELPQEMQPERDLWPQIESRVAGAPAAVGSAAATPAEGRRARHAPRARWRVQLAAAVGLLMLGAALTAGVWITHGSAVRGPLPQGSAAIGRMSPLIGPVDARRSETLLRSLDARLQALPPPSRRKVLADLAVIEQSMMDIQTALGRDPGNALLRQMLLESYQDEQQLIATVQEAGVWTREAGTGEGSI